MLLVPGLASAVGLGELRGQPYLGQGLSVEIDILGAEKINLDAACFRLVQPAGSGDMPWLKKAGLSVRKGAPAVLEIRSEAPLREPILQLAVELACGHEVSREYILLASPAPESLPSARNFAPLSRSPSAETVQSAPRTERFRPISREAASASKPPVPRQVEKKFVPNPLPDRVMLSNDEGVEELSLRFATDLSMSGATGNESMEEQREILRLEFRMLQAMQEQATTQLATAEKLRNMEATLGELQQRAAVFSERIDKSGAPLAESPAKPQEAPVVDIEKQESVRSNEATVKSRLSEWSLYGVLAGALFGFAGWLGWREYRERQRLTVDEEFAFAAPAIAIDPKRSDEFDEFGDVDLHVEPSAIDAPMAVDVELDGIDANAGKSPAPRPAGAPLGHDSVMSISATTLDEHFEANPVMELADIMLSFGRVKGAAQALQEYIDNNPQEALQPWIRLMDVYRMAGMRPEFETVAHNLNQHFNVEIQKWDAGRPEISELPDEKVSGEASAVELALVDVARPESLEDMPRLLNMVIELWPTGDVVGYLYQLLRDNRGGKRAGFALQVVEDILFLIELKETSNRMEKDV